MTTPGIDEIFHRSLTAHLPKASFARLHDATVLVGGLGGGSNIAELLVRKGVGRLIIADLDVYEPHNIRQRGCLASTLGREKVEVMRERLKEVNPHVEVVPVSEGITPDNAETLARQCDVVVEMLDFSALREKLALHRAARTHNKAAMTAPSVVNGAMLWVFAPDGLSFEEFIGYEEGLPLQQLGLRMLKRGIPRFPPEAPEAMYLSAARGERTIPLDAVGVDQAAVLAVSAVENLILGRSERVVFAPRGIYVDVSNPPCLCEIIDYSTDFASAPCRTR